MPYRASTESIGTRALMALKSSWDLLSPILLLLRIANLHLDAGEEIELQRDRSVLIHESHAAAVPVRLVAFLLNDEYFFALGHYSPPFKGLPLTLRISHEISSVKSYAQA